MKHIKKFNQIYEIRQQLEIPFDGKHPLHDKPTHIHLLDALSDLDKENDVDIEDYKSDWTNSDISEAWSKYEDDAFQEYKDNSVESDYYYISSYYLNSYPPSEYPDMYNDEINNYIEENDDATYWDIASEFNLEDSDITDYLSDEGYSEYDNVLRSVFDENLDEYNCMYTLKEEMTDDGLIPIYRAINYSAEDKKDTYISIMTYSSVGVFWSFDFNGAIDHNGGKGDTFILCAFIKPEYIDWTQTIYKSAWSLRDEKEVEVLEDQDIMVYSIIDQKSGKELKQDKPFIVKT